VIASGDDLVIPSPRSTLKLRDIAVLGLLTAGAFLILGYHPGVEDAEIYVPGIKKILNPSLYPFGSEFFTSHSRMTLFHTLIATCVRLSHLSLDTVMLIWQIASIFLVLLACWKIANICFGDAASRWACVCLVAAMLMLPVAGTALSVMDEYFNPRSFALFTSLFAIARAMEKRYLRASLWIILCALVHPLMSVFALSLIVVIVWLEKLHLPWLATSRTGAADAVAASSAALLPLGISFRYPSEAYREAVQMRWYFFLLRWRWYEWLGFFLPIALLWWFAMLAKRRRMENLALLCQAVIAYQIVYFILALIITIPPRLVALARYQPMRSLQLLYVILLIAAGGLLGKYVLRARVWRWLALFVPICAIMLYTQRQVFAAIPQIEWPGVAPKNDWLKAFVWIRSNTPEDAIFALNPKGMDLPGEDEQGFRALAERSMLADDVKDASALTMFPDLPLAEEWQRQVKAQQGWDHFQKADFERLRRDWGVTWAVVDQAGVTGLDCPYSNPTVRVCRLP
jgi:hypothetical protein